MRRLLPLPLLLLIALAGRDNEAKVAVDLPPEEQVLVDTAQRRGLATSAAAPRCWSTAKPPPSP